ncbi:hypothetical protein CY34DRAFT_111126, partial [Suillus luteus UH-Slu-Lm8-n1]
QIGSNGAEKNHSTPNEKAAAMRAAKLQSAKDTAMTATQEEHSRPARQAKSTACNNKDHIKQPRVQVETLAKTAAPVKGKPQNGSHTMTVEQLFDSDSDIREPSLGDSDEFKSPKDGSEDDSMSEDDLRDSEDDLQALKGDSKKLKEVLDFESSDIEDKSLDLLESPHPTADMKTHRYRERVPKESKGLKKTSKFTQKASNTKQQQKREQEKPAWRTENASDTPPEDVPAIPRAKSAQMREEDWPPNSQIVYSNSGKPEGRISYLYLNVQKAVEAHVASHYGLTKGMDEKVAELLKNNVFIYPLNSKGEPTHSKPFQAPAILDTLADAFFSDDTGAGVKFHDSLTSILEDHPDKFELPVAMVALAGAAVCSVIMHYSSEKYDRDFNSDLYGGIYKTLVSTLNSIFKNSKCKFHVLMHSLYMTV